MGTNENAKIHILFYESDEAFEGALPYFSDLRKQKLFRTVNPEAKFQQAAAELTVCAAMKSAKLPFNPPEYVYNELGKPCIKDGFISISHTKNASACVIFNKPVGLDIEFNRRVNPLIADKILSSREFSKFIETKNRNEFLMKTWAAKESFLKLTGQGLRKGMMNTDFNIETGAIFGENGARYSVIQKQLSYTSDKCSPENINGSKANCFIALCTEAPVDAEFIVYNSFSEIIDFLKK